LRAKRETSRATTAPLSEAELRHGSARNRRGGHRCGERTISLWRDEI